MRDERRFVCVNRDELTMLLSLSLVSSVGVVLQCSFCAQLVV
jgi:hypothetical protein